LGNWPKASSRGAAEAPGIPASAPCSGHRSRSPPLASNAEAAGSTSSTEGSSHHSAQAPAEAAEGCGATSSALARWNLQVPGVPAAWKAVAKLCEPVRAWPGTPQAPLVPPAPCCAPLPGYYTPGGLESLSRKMKAMVCSRGHVKGFLQKQRLRGLFSAILVGLLGFKAGKQSMKKFYSQNFSLPRQRSLFFM